MGSAIHWRFSLWVIFTVFTNRTVHFFREARSVGLAVAFASTHPCQGDHQ